MKSEITILAQGFLKRMALGLAIMIGPQLLLAQILTYIKLTEVLFH